MAFSSEHTVKVFDNEIGELRGLIAEMGGRAEAAIAQAMEALVHRDLALADRVVIEDRKIDRLEQEVERLAVRIIALRAPMADDLRDVIAALKISGVIERIGDYSKNIAKRVPILNQTSPLRSIRGLERMGKLVQEQLKDVLDALSARNQNAAYDVWRRDEEIDDLNNSLFRELLTYMMEDPRTITVSIHMLFIAKNLERVGDHCTNVAETIHYLKTGAGFDGDRPKSDTTVNTSAMADEA